MSLQRISCLRGYFKSFTRPLSWNIRLAITITFGTGKENKEVQAKIFTHEKNYHLI